MDAIALLKADHDKAKTVMAELDGLGSRMDAIKSEQMQEAMPDRDKVEL